MSKPTETPPDQSNSGHPVLFEDQQIRRKFHKGEWHFVLVDVIAALTGSVNPADYLNKLRKRDTELAKGYGQIVHPLSIETAGGVQRLNCATAEGLFRIVQSVPSPKAEPFKLWLAKVGYERLQEEEDPARAIDRAISTYKRRGWTDERIKARIDSVIKRNLLTAEWHARGVKEHKHYAILTNRIYSGTFGLDKKGLCRAMGLPEKANPREAMSAVALSLSSLGDTVAVELMRENDAQGVGQCMSAANQAGAIAGEARRSIEKALGRPVITPVVAKDKGTMPLLPANSPRKKAS